MQKQTLGERIATYRRERQLTQRQLADHLGVSDKSVSKWERDISCPDLTLLPTLSEALGVSVDVLLGAEAENGAHAFLSLEKYLMGEYGYTVPDLHPKGERAVLLLDAPSHEDATHGVALSGSMGAAAAQALYGEEEPLGLRLYREDGVLGVTYVSPVPLFAPSEALAPLTSELEYTRCGRYDIHRYLLSEFQKKVYSLIEREDIAAIAMTRDFNKKYFFTALAYASPHVIRAFDRRMHEGTLRLFFVGTPSLTWIGKDVGGKLYDFPDFRELLFSLS